MIDKLINNLIKLPLDPRTHLSNTRWRPALPPVGASICAAEEATVVSALELRMRPAAGGLPVIALPVIALLVVTGGCAGGGDGDGQGSGIGTTTAAATISEVTGFGSNPGNLRMWEFVPPGLPSGAPLVVVMHGCTESADVIATETEWNELATRFGFAVTYPEQQSSNNFQLCFNWFQTGDISRGQGEALSIAQMVDSMKSRHGSDPARVFVTGMSAGGFMTTVMMAAYPDVFAGGAVNSGGAYRCASSLLETTSCQQGSVNRSPAQWGDLVRGAFSGYSGPYPRLVAFHGSSDFTVNAANLDQSVAQWTNVLGVDQAPEVDETFRTATHRVYRDASGADVVETYTIGGMGHALTVDPGAAVDQGGATGAFSEDHDVYSSYYAALFFGLVSDDGGDGGDDAGDGGDGSDGGDDSGGDDSGTDDGGGDGGGGALLETFSAGGAPDNAGWTLGGWAVDSSRDADGAPGSASLGGAAAPAFNTVTRTASWSGLTLGAGQVLTYARQLSLSDVNVAASARFQVIVNDGADHVVDSKAISGIASYAETAWTPRTADLSAYAGKTVTLKLVVSATDPLSSISSARAWVDQISIE